jgi:hypothetical protein
VRAQIVKSARSLTDLSLRPGGSGGHFTVITAVPAATIRQRFLEGPGCMFIHDRRATRVRAHAAERIGGSP